MRKPEWWVLNVLAPEWRYVLDQLILKHLGHGPHRTKAFVDGTRGHPVYYIKRSALPCEVLAQAIGARPEDLDRTKEVNLRAVDPEGDERVPAPTVDYYGEA